MPKYGGKSNFQPREFPRSEWKVEGLEKKNLLDFPSSYAKIWGETNSHGSFPEVGEKQKA